MIETINSKYNLSNPKIKKLVGYDMKKECQFLLYIETLFPQLIS